MNPRLFIPFALVFAFAAPLVSQSSAEVVTAVLASADGENLRTLVEVQLAEMEGVSLVARADIDRILEQRSLEINGLAEGGATSRSDLGALVGADVLVFIESRENSGTIRLVDCATGVVLDSGDIPTLEDATEVENWLKSLTTTWPPLFDKAGRGSGDLVPISVGTFLPYQMTKNRETWINQELRLALVHRLSAYSKLLVLERGARLEDIALEGLLSNNKEESGYLSGIAQISGNYAFTDRDKTHVELSAAIASAEGRVLAETSMEIAVDALSLATVELATWGNAILLGDQAEETDEEALAKEAAGQLKHALWCAKVGLWDEAFDAGINADVLGGGGNPRLARAIQARGGAASLIKGGALGELAGSPYSEEIRYWGYNPRPGGADIAEMRTAVRRAREALKIPAAKGKETSHEDFLNCMEGVVVNACHLIRSYWESGLYQSSAAEIETLRADLASLTQQQLQEMNGLHLRNYGLHLAKCFSNAPYLFRSVEDQIEFQRKILDIMEQEYRSTGRYHGSFDQHLPPFVNWERRPLQELENVFRAFYRPFISSESRIHRAFAQQAATGGADVATLLKIADLEALKVEESTAQGFDQLFANLDLWFSSSHRYFPRRGQSVLNTVNTKATRAHSRRRAPLMPILEAAPVRTRLDLIQAIAKHRPEGQGSYTIGGLWNDLLRSEKMSDEEAFELDSLIREIRPNAVDGEQWRRFAQRFPLIMDHWLTLREAEEPLPEICRPSFSRYKTEPSPSDNSNFKRGAACANHRRLVLFNAWELSLWDLATGEFERKIPMGNIIPGKDDYLYQIDSMKLARMTTDGSHIFAPLGTGILHSEDGEDWKFTPSIHDTWAIISITPNVAYYQSGSLGNNWRLYNGGGITAFDFRTGKETLVVSSSRRPARHEADRMAANNTVRIFHPIIGTDDLVVANRVGAVSSVSPDGKCKVGGKYPTKPKKENLFPIRDQKEKVQLRAFAPSTEPGGESYFYRGGEIEGRLGDDPVQYEGLSWIVERHFTPGIDLRERHRLRIRAPGREEVFMPLQLTLPKEVVSEIEFFEGAEHEYRERTWAMPLKRYSDTYQTFEIITYTVPSPYGIAFGRNYGFWFLPMDSINEYLRSAGRNDIADLLPSAPSTAD